MPPEKDPFEVISRTAPQIADTQSQIAKYSSNLASSPTASSSALPATPTDISNETQQDALQTQLKSLQKQNLTAAWYGADKGSTSADQGGSPGVISSVLNWLQQPLHGVVKGVKSVIGDTTYVPNQEFTDLLAQHGVGGLTGTALGLTADIILDPVNWITAGTGALVPRVALGVKEAGLAGAAKGAMSSSLGTSSAWLARKAPFMGGEQSALYKILNEKVSQSAATYNALTNTDPLRYITQPGIGRGLASAGTLGKFAPVSGMGFTIGDATKQLFSYLPNGDDMFKSLYYDPKDWIENAKAIDVVDKLKIPATAANAEEAAAAVTGTTGAPSAAAIAAGEADSLSALKPNLEILRNVPAGQERAAMTDELSRAVSDVNFIGDNAAKIASVNPEQNAYRIGQEAAHIEELRKTLEPIARDFGQVGPTGVQWWDNFVKWGNNKKFNFGDTQIAPIKAFLDSYQFAIQRLFKPAHTSLSLSTSMMNVISAPPMYGMIGGDMGALVPLYAKSYLGFSGVDPMANIVRNLLGAPTKGGAEGIAQANRAKSFASILETNPGLIRKSTGVGPAWFLGNQSVDDMKRMAIANKAYSEEEIASGVLDREVLEANQKMRDELAAGNVGGPKKTLIASMYERLGKMVTSPATTASDLPESPAMQGLRSRAAAAQSGADLPLAADFAGTPGSFIPRMQEPAGFTIQDTAGVNLDLINKVDTYINQQAQSNRAFGLFQDLMNGARAGYERQDQSFRMAVMLDLMNNGIPANRLKIMSRFVPVTNPETQILSRTTRDGQTIYHMSADYALEVAHEAAINYGAMPAAIRMLRSLPLVGAPFASFSYAMGIRTAQTAAYNPAFYNKIAFGMQSLSGHKTPLEKEAMKGKYYSWYNDPSMVRLPDAFSKFITQYPLYTNLSNALPYYSLNIFQPSNRTYSAVLPDTVVKMLDQSPIMKDPLGQTVFDNIVLPMILSRTGERPMSQVGSPLYPINATGADKAFYMGRGLVDSFTPAIISPVGALMSPDYAKYYPGARTRGFSYGQATGSTQYPSENKLGIPGTEPTASRFIRNILGYVGIPIEMLNTKYAASQAGAGAVQ